MKVTLIKCPWWVRYCPPYILSFFATLLRQKGHEVFPFDLNNSLYYKVDSKFKKYWDDRDYYSFWENPAFIKKLLLDTEFETTVNKILNTHAEVICFTTHTPNVLISLELAKKIKQKDKSRIIMFIGHKCSHTQMAFDFIRKSQVDYVCTGEADLALCELMNKLSSRKDKFELPECQGFLLKRNGKVIDCGNPPIVRDLDTLPFPDYSDFIEDIKKGLYSQPRRLDILDSRGCINACYFCYEKLYWQKYRTLTGKRIYEQICYHMDKLPQNNYFYFNGLLLNANLKVLNDFCDLVIKNGLKINWAGQAMIHPDMTQEFLIKMRKAGCVWLGYGIESGSQEVLNRMNKKIKVSDAVKVLKDSYEAGISVQINIMFGFPTETEKDFEQTCKFLIKVRPYIDNVLASQSFCTLEKETYMWKHPDEFGITGEKHHLFWKSNNGKNNYVERFKRYERFCELALKLGIPETSGVLLVKPDKWLLLGKYYQHEKRYKDAIECFKKSLKIETENHTTHRILNECYKKLKKNE